MSVINEKWQKSAYNLTRDDNRCYTFVDAESDGREHVGAIRVVTALTVLNNAREEVTQTYPSGERRLQLVLAAPQMARALRKCLVRLSSIPTSSPDREAIAEAMEALQAAGVPL